MSDASQFLDLAEEELVASQLLLQNTYYRACISRAYYAMYYATQALLTTRDIESRTHKGVLQQFSQSFVQSGDLPVSMAQNLKRTYGLRQLGDYEADVVLTEELATQALEAAVEFVEQVRRYLGNSD
ncbi:HEPN domain-containing protein [Adonisia turfae]|uniref:HEPN domain-containing protein n=1 Tax=Adonisia turfae CCMR0081 TaxID=2292702 RepID=A0A6M0RVW0_9CYAN|nr:HEPN domain-containing protein [Adonisia turfae]NEZ59931.1 HEPN domain-containing protein [Adonisia turfae CCMR0081]